MKLNGSILGLGISPEILSENGSFIMEVSQCMSISITYSVVMRMRDLTSHSL